MCHGSTLILDTDVACDHMMDSKACNLLMTTVNVGVYWPVAGICPSPVCGEMRGQVHHRLLSTTSILYCISSDPGGSSLLSRSQETEPKKKKKITLDANCSHVCVFYPKWPPSWGGGGGRNNVQAVSSLKTET